VFAIANAALAWLASAALAGACAYHTVPLIGPIGGAVVDAACGNLEVTLVVAALGAGALMLLVCSHELHRGIADVGFVGTTLRAERKRRHGI
jgi:rhomboid protease GluP